MPLFSPRQPKIINLSRIDKIATLLNDKMIIQIVPGRPPGGTPNRNIPLGNLIKGVGFEHRHDFENGRLESRFWGVGIRSPNGRTWKIFSTENLIDVTIRVISQSPSSRKQQPLIHCKHVFDTQSPLLFRCANVFPGP